MKNVKIKTLGFLKVFLFSIMIWAPVLNAQSLTHDNLVNLENLVTEYATQVSEQQQLKDDLLEYIQLDQDNLELLRSEEQRYIADGETARALAIKARLIKYGYDYQDKQIELELYNSLISIFSADNIIAAQLYSTYENAWLDDSHTADALNHDYYQLLQDNYDDVQQVYNYAAEQRSLLSEQAGNESVPDGIDALLEIASQTAEAAYYSSRRKDYYEEVLTQIDGLNAGWGMTASAKLLNKQAKNYDLMAGVFENLNQWVGQSYNQLADHYSGQESTEAISQFYQQRTAVNDTAPEKLRSIASGMRTQASRSLTLGAAFNNNAPELDLAQLFGFSVNANEALAEVFSNMSEDEYWQSLYEQAKNDIDQKIEENLATAVEYESLLAEAEQYESEYEQVINDETGIQNFTDVEQATELPPAPNPTISTVPNQGSEGYYVGSIAGDIEVGGDGQPAWSMPIDMPPGVRGLAPQLTLSVDSVGAVSMGGISAISRCGSTFADDGINRPVDFSLNDKLCLNGQPLVVVSGQYGAPGSEYRTRSESFDKIVAHGSSGNGPSSFVVHTRSGGNLHFGLATLDKSYLTDTNTIISWQLSELYDAAGNGVFYTYTDISSSPTVIESVLGEVTYGAKSKPSATLSVKFSYEPKSDNYQGYNFGGKYQSTHRLKQIVTAAGDKTKRKYSLSYEQSQITGTSKLSSIEECAGSQSTSPCYRPSYFTYTPETSGWLSTSISQPDTLQDGLGRLRGVIIDINGDGLNDWITAIQPQTGNAEIQTWLGSPNGWLPSSTFSLPGPIIDYKITSEGIPVGNLADMNGDGLIDYFQAYHQTHADGSKTIKRTTWLNTGNGFAVNAALRPPYYTMLIKSDDSIEAFDKYVDVNGDGLPDQVRAMRRKAGTYSRITRLNTGSGWEVSTAYRIPAGLFSDHSIGSIGSYQGELIDINGDGLVDFIESAKVSNTVIRSRTYLNTGSGWAASSAFKMPTPLVDYSVNDKGLSNAELVDINGDGLLDVWQAVKMPDNSFVKAAWLNDGAKFVSAPEFTPPWYSARHRVDGYTDVVGTHIDLDGNGKPEFVLFYRSSGNITSMNIWKHNGDSWINARTELVDKLPNIPFFQHFIQQSGINIIHFADIDGDVLPEAFSSISGLSNGQLVYRAPLTPEGEQPGMLIETINGLKLVTRLEYGISTDTALYTPTTEPSSYPDLSVNTPMILVKTVHKMDGLTHPDKVYGNPGGSGWYSVNHEYEGLRVNVVGRGSYGFKKRRISDNRTGNVIESEFNQTWPYIGMVKRSTSSLNGQPLTESVSEFDYLSLNNGKTNYPYVHRTTASRFENGLLASTTVKTIEVDDFGNITNESVRINGSNNQTIEKLITRKYQNNTANWLIGLPTEKSTAHKVLNTPDIVHVIHRTFDSDGFVQSEVFEPSHAYSITTNYSYDGFGNAIQTNITAGSNSRQSTTSFTADGRFPSVVTNALGHSNQIKYKSTSGKVIRKTDANGLIKETVYNDFDAVIKEQIKREDDPGQREVSLPYWCESTTQPACPNHALYFVSALDDQGESPQTVYYDAFGREIMKISTGWDKQTVYQMTEYDSLGRKTGISQPGYQRSNLNWTRSEYDVHDRITKRISPDNTATTYTYNVLSSTVTNALNQTTTISNNLQGKPILAVDNAGTATSYQYDAEGKLLTTIDSNGNRIETRYDLFGRKTFMDDPDMGQWSYEYDAFGNMVKQIDAKGQITSMEYDVLNRLTKRIEQDGTTQWVYDTARLGDFGQARGMLHYVTSSDGYTRSHFYDQFSRPIKEQVTIKNKTYTTQRGYYRASDKIDWVKYPSGLVTRTEHNEYGFPTRLTSIDLDKYTNYPKENDKYQKLYFDAKEIESANKTKLDHHKSGFDKHKAIGDIKLDQIQNIYDQAKVIGKEADRLAGLTNTNAIHARKYYNEYVSAYRSYEESVKVARKFADSANWKLKVAKYNVDMINHHNNKIKDHINYIKYELGNICNNVSAVLGGAECDVKSGTQEWRANAIGEIVKRHSGYIKINQQKAAHFEMLYKQNTREYERLARESDKWGGYARGYANSAQAKLDLMNRYQQKARNYEHLYKLQIAKYEAKGGKWKIRSQAGSSCIAREGEDKSSKYCLIKLGDAQRAEDAYFTSSSYQQLVHHRDEYDRIVNLVNAAIAAAQKQADIVTTLQDEILESTTVYWETLDVAADGQIKEGRLGNGVETAWNYDELGRTSRILAQLDNTDLQDMFFDYDFIGNLSSREDHVENLYESFGYDSMNRLTSASLSGNGAELYQMVGQETQTFQYDAIGNLTFKSDVGQYIYGENGAGVHAVTSTSGDINASFTYDVNGNQVSGYGRTIEYSSFNKPVRMNKSGAVNQFNYGPERQLTYQSEQISGKTRQTRYVGGIFEETVKEGKTEAVHHLKLSKFTIAVLKTAPNLTAVNSTHYLHQDHLDSVVMITDDNGNVVEKNHYDAFGKKRLAVIDSANQSIYAAGFLPITDRSFTGHRYLKSQELVHMKGRVFDPTFGRFLSADPHIQSPFNSQSLNRYSYVLNNPLSLNDPSGYLFGSLKKLWKKLKRLVKKIIKKVVAVILKVINVVIKAIPIKPIRNFVDKYWQPILQIAAIFIPPLQPLATALIYFNAAASFASGASLTKLLATFAIQMTIPNVKGLGGFNNVIDGFNSVVTSVKNVISSVGNAIGGAVTKAIVGAGAGLGRGLTGVWLGATTAAVISGAIISGVTSKILGGSFSKTFRRSLSPASIVMTAVAVGHKLHDQVKTAAESMPYGGPDNFDPSQIKAMGDSARMKYEAENSENYKRMLVERGENAENMVNASHDFMDNSSTKFGYAASTSVFLGPEAWPFTVAMGGLSAGTGAFAWLLSSPSRYDYSKFTADSILTNIPIKNPAVDYFIDIVPPSAWFDTVIDDGD